MGYAHDDPPSDWLGNDVVKVTDDLYYEWTEQEANPRFWHWCTAGQRWVGQGTASHDLLCREPLHLEPSLLWTCCNLHGWVRRGVWTPA